MTTAQDIVYEAAELAKVKATNGSLQPANQTRYLSLLNRMLKGWRNEGIDLKLNTTLAITDTVYIDDSDEMGIVYNLAKMISSLGGSPISPLVLEIANSSLESLRSKYLEINDMDLDRSLTTRRNFDYVKGY